MTDPKQIWKKHGKYGSRAKWRKGTRIITFPMFMYLGPTDMLWDNLAHRPQTSGFLWNWPYLSLRNSFDRGRFSNAERTCETTQTTESRTEYREDWTGSEG